MKNQTLVVTLINSLLFNTLINQDAIAQTADQIRKMSSVGVPVVLPSYIPRGFQLTSFKTDLSDHHGYDAVYRGTNNCTIRLSTRDEGWGALESAVHSTGSVVSESVRQWAVNTPLFGKITLELEEEDGSRLNLSVDVLPNPDSRKGVLPGFPKAGYEFNFNCKYNLFSPQQAFKILKSMRIVK